MSRGRTPTPTQVLVVDDDESIRTSLCNVLVMEGYRALAAASGKQALALLHAEPGGQVVVLDYQMPEMTGETLLLTVLADSTLALRLTFVVMTATMQLPGSFATLLSGRHIPIVWKPFDLDQLLAAVAEAAVCIEALAADAGDAGG